MHSCNVVQSKYRKKSVSKDLKKHFRVLKAKLTNNNGKECLTSQVTGAYMQYTSHFYQVNNSNLETGKGVEPPPPKKKHPECTNNCFG